MYIDFNVLYAVSDASVTCAAYVAAAFSVIEITLFAGIVTAATASNICFQYPFNPVTSVASKVFPAGLIYPVSPNADIL